MVTEAKIDGGETLLEKQDNAGKLRRDLAATLDALDRRGLLLPAAHAQAALNALDDALRID